MTFIVKIGLKFNIMESLFIQSIDEFNYTSCVNFFNEKYSNPSVLCLPGFEIMFYNFNKIIISKLQNTNGLLLSNDNELKSNIDNELKKESLNYNDLTLNQSGLELNDMHIYKFMFSSLAKDMYNKSSELYRPKKDDYYLIKDKLKGIDKKIITINGRNLSGDRISRNNSLFDLIVFLISRNYYVINCTIPNPCFKHYFDSNSYLEIDETELYDYSMNISYFLNSDCLITVSNAAGVTNHICTKSNIILYGEGGWVDNPEFGFNGSSLYDISKNIKPTYKASDFEQIYSLIETLNKPEDVTFFDETKIIY